MPKPSSGEYLFYVARPVYVIVKGTLAEAKAAREAILETANLPGEYVDWFEDIPNVSRAGTSDDPCEPLDNGKIEEY